jgi:hypothetical protein
VAKRTRDAVTPHQEEMRDDKADERGGQQKYVRRVPPQQRQRPERRTTLQQPGDLLAKRPAARDVDRHGRCPIRLLIPRQQISSQSKAQDQQQENDAGDPSHFARVLV